MLDWGRGVECEVVGVCGEFFFSLFLVGRK